MVTTRSTQGPIGEGSNDPGRASAEGQDTRLLERLRQLVADEGRGRAVEQLGVDRKTVWRVLNSERLNPVVREALLGLDTEVSDSDEGGRDDAGVRELRHRIAILEDLLPDVEGNWLWLPKLWLKCVTRNRLLLPQLLRLSLQVHRQSRRPTSPVASTPRLSCWSRVPTTSRSTVPWCSP